MINRNYIYLNWFFTVLLGPVFWLLFEAIINGENGNLFEIILPFVGLGLIYSLPLLAISFFVFQFLGTRIHSVFLVKFIMIIIGLTGMCITLIIITKHLNLLTFKWMLSYSIPLVCFAIFSKVKVKMIH